MSRTIRRKHLNRENGTTSFGPGSTCLYSYFVDFVKPHWPDYSDPRYERLVKWIHRDSPYALAFGKNHFERKREQHKYRRREDLKVRLFLRGKTEDVIPERYHFYYTW